MERDALISAWQAADTTSKSSTELITMLRDGQHPVLKHMRRQLIIEIIAFTIFLFLYYDLFDGDQKPLYANLLIAGGMLLVIIHNILGYIYTRHTVIGNNIKQSLELYLVSLKKHAIISIMCRALMAACLLLFFTSVMNFNATKFWSMITIVIMLSIQLIVLWSLWRKRIGKLKGTINSLAL